MADLITTADAAQRLGISERRVRAIAVRRGLGTKITPRLRLFTAAEVEAMRERRPGRPKKAQ